MRTQKTKKMKILRTGCWSISALFFVVFGSLFVGSCLNPMTHSFADVASYTMSIFSADDDTKFSTRFSESAFLAIRVGDSETKVLKELGDPLTIDRYGDSEGWSYSTSESGMSYWVREIWFSKERRVDKKEMYYFFD